VVASLHKVSVCVWRGGGAGGYGILNPPAPPPHTHSPYGEMPLLTHSLSLSCVCEGECVCECMHVLHFYVCVYIYTKNVCVYVFIYLYLHVYT
jgi:hypothetical protein